MFSSLKHLFQILSSAQKAKLISLQFLVIVNSIFEVISVASIGLFMTLVSNFNDLESSVVFIEVSKLISFSSGQSFLLFAAQGALLILILTTIMSVFSLWRLSLFGSQVGADLSNRLYYFYMEQPWIFHANNNSSDLKNRIANESLRISSGVINHLMLVNAKIIMCIIMSAAVMIYNFYIAISAAIIFSTAYFILYQIAQSRLIRNGAIVSIAQANRLKLMGEGFGGIKDVLLLGRQQLFNRQFFKASNNFARASASTQVLSMAPRFIMELVAFSSIILLVIVLLSSYQDNIGEILPLLTIYALAGFKLLPAFQQIYYSFTTIRGNLNAFHILQDDLSSSDSNYPIHIKNSTLDNARMEVSKNILLKDISYKYPDAQNDALYRINMDIPVNHVIGIVGSSGSGKSTLIDILLGLIDPAKGELSADGIPINKDNMRLWQNSLGFVPQNIFLSDDTIKENIAFGLHAGEIDDEKILHAVEMAHLKEFVATLENGIDTIVGERGVKLSGGQRQRIGIARALYQNAGFLILDEATSSLDGISEKLIMNAIDDFSGKKTIIIIAHRLTTVKNCNKIYILEAGKIIDHGSFDELKHKNKFFQQMLNPASSPKLTKNDS